MMGKKKSEKKMPFTEGKSFNKDISIFGHLYYLSGMATTNNFRQIGYSKEPILKNAVTGDAFEYMGDEVSILCTSQKEELMFYYIVYDKNDSIKDFVRVKSKFQYNEHNLKPRLDPKESFVDAFFCFSGIFTARVKSITDTK